VSVTIDESLLHGAISRASSLGAKYVEVRYQRDVATETVMREGNVIGVGKGVSEGVGIRVIVNGSLGFASTNELTREGLSRAAEIAVSRARALAPLKRSPIEFSDDRVGRASYEVIPKKSLEDFSVEDRIVLGSELHKAVVTSVKEVGVAVTTYTFEDHVQEKLIVTSDGGYVASKVPRVFIMLNFILMHQQRGSIQRVIEWGASGGPEWVSSWRPVDEVREEVRNLERVLIKGVEPPKEEVDVVLGPEVVGLLVHESAGHPMEADRILGREAAQAGESYVKPGMVGSYRVGSELVTVVEDPTVPGSYGYYLFDDEAVPARPRYLYRDGVIYEALHNRHTGRVFGVGSNGAARAMDYASEPIIRMSNTYFKPGDMGFEELIEDISQGVYIKSYMEWNIDDVRWNQRYVGLEAYMIRNGELAEPVKNPVLEITTKGLYSRVTGVDRNLKFFPGMCGKGEPAQGVPVWFGGPNIRVSKVRLGVVR